VVGLALEARRNKSAEGRGGRGGVADVQGGDESPWRSTSRVGSTCLDIQFNFDRRVMQYIVPYLAIYKYTDHANPFTMYHQPALRLHSPFYYRRSTSSTCNAPYPNTTNTPQNTANPTASSHRARLLNPKLDRIAEPGTSISSPYLWSASVSVRTSLTIRPSKAKWKMDN